MDFIEIKELEKILNLNNNICYKTILRFGNDFGVKLLHDFDGDIIIPKSLFNDIFDKIKEIERSLTDYSFIVKNRKKTIPFEGSGYIYYLFNGGDLLYIGQSTNIGQRIGSHFKSDKVFNEVYTELCEPNELLLVEAFYIYRDFPNGNVSKMTDEQYLYQILTMINIDEFFHN